MCVAVQFGCEGTGRSSNGRPGECSTLFACGGLTHVQKEAISATFLKGHILMVSRDMRCATARHASKQARFI